MAAPTTHILLADAFLKTAPQSSPVTFIVGTSFPDIRHLGSLSREQTHLRPIDLASIREESDPFLAGMLFHNYVDITRKAYWARRPFINDCRYQSTPKKPSNYTKTSFSTIV